MSIRATHGAAYNAEISEEAESDDSSRQAPPHAEDRADDQRMDSVETRNYVFAYDASPSDSRQVRTLADAEDAYASN